MKKRMLVAPLLALAVSASSLMAANFQGSGSSFAGPIYKKWLAAYYQVNGTQINYAIKGSSKGIKDIEGRLVDFAGSDAPLKPADLKKHHLYQWPTVVGAIAMCYNIPGVGNQKLKLSQQAIVDIAADKIKYWDNPEITKENRSLHLPHKRIIFVHRSDGSGTTFNFTYFLSTASKHWKNEYGFHTTIDWPGNHNIGGNHNSGVAALIKENPYSVGYADFADARSAGLDMARVENKAGKYIKPEIKYFQKGAANASFDPKVDFYAAIANPKGTYSYPIIMGTFVLVPTEKKEMNKSIVKFFDWSFKNGAHIAAKLGYVPLPEVLTNKIRKYWASKGL
jgi:phosphate transport system substrate-binding protein